MASKLYNGLTLPILDTAIPIPPAGKVILFARINQSVWVKYSDGTEERISE
jgi:hypothetical protein